MNENVAPITKSDRFGIFRGRTEPTGEIVESEQVGFAYSKPGSRMFRLRLWMLQKEQFFLAPDDRDPKAYVILALDEYKLPTGEMKKLWSKIGRGNCDGIFVRLDFWLLNRELYLCLFPQNAEVEGARAA